MFFSLSLLITLFAQINAGSICPVDWFDCGNGKCVASLWRCDGDNDCGNLKDEESCEVEISPSPKACLGNSFQCVSDGHCIPQTWQCDGDHDCDDNSDEINCENKTQCEGFRCKDHRCIPQKWRCDGWSNCVDQSDEEECPTIAGEPLCTSSEFRCTSGTCLDRKLVCDGEMDCSDASDEGRNCSDLCSNETCSQNCRQMPSGPECFCNTGYQLHKDNKTCLDIDECEKEGICSQHCTNLIGSYICSCMDGYELVNNKTCRASGVEPLLVFSTLGEIRGMYLRSKRLFTIQKAIIKATAVDADLLESKLYWVEISNKSSVYSSKLDSTEFSVILAGGLMVPEDIAVDYVARNLYFTDSGLKQVLACKMDGSMCHVLHQAYVQKPRAIALDPPGGFLYWSDWGNATSGIYRSGMDGSNRTTLVSRDVKWPNGIAIDPVANHLYWTDASRQTIEYITLDGRTRKALVNKEVFHPYSLAVFEDNLYWSDWQTFSLVTCDKFTAHQRRIFSKKHIMGVHVYHPVLARNTSNPCWNSSCSHMCLLAPLGGYSCACPQGFFLSSNKRTCAADENFPMILVSDESSVHHIRPEAVGNNAVAEIPFNHFGKIGKLAYDWETKTLFLSELHQPAIYAINMTNLARRELVRNHLSTPADLAFDSLSGNLYWVDSSKGTVEVVSVETSQTATIIEGLSKPIAIALVPAISQMFISAVGENPSVFMYDMDGKNERRQDSVFGFAVSLAVHPAYSLLYWADVRAGSISSIDYLNTKSRPVMIKQRVGSAISIAVNEKYVYWTDTTHNVLSFLSHNSTFTHTISLPGLKSGMVDRSVIYAASSTAQSPRGIVSCKLRNGDCSHLCLTSPGGRSCVCPHGMVIYTDEITCREASDRCIVNDFRCRNGHCILSSWKCDRRDDCGDNSDEEGCFPPNSCADDQFSCGGGECISKLWRCDGETDCGDASDEAECDATLCDTESHLRCDNGQCVPISWACDGSYDCYDYTDETNCARATIRCKTEEYFCTNNSRCISRRWICDGDNDCGDAADEIPENCTATAKPTSPVQKSNCEEYSCSFSSECIPWSSVCNGIKDCASLMDEGRLCDSSCQGDQGGCSHNCQKTPDGPRCSCFSGYALSNDNKTCIDVNECEIPGICSHFCNNTKGDFKCSCADGYFLEHDHKHCKADGGTAAFVYMLPDQIRGIDLNTGETRVYVKDREQVMTGMDYDTEEGIFFWSDWKKGTINSFVPNTNKQDVLLTASEKPYFVRWDWIAEKIYYTDETGSIICCTKYGQSCNTVIQNTAPRVNGWDISPTTGLMFWSVWAVVLHQDSGVIERAKLDGSSRMVIVSDRIVWPTSVTVDHILKMVYWTDAKLNIMECTDFHGLKRRTVVANDLHYPFSMTMFEDYVYWSDWGTDSIIRCDKFGGQNCSTFYRGNVKAEVVMVVHKANQPKGGMQTILE